MSGGRREQNRQRECIRTTIDWGVERERQRADELQRREGPGVEELAAAREPGEEPGPGQGVVPMPGGQPGNRGRLGGVSETPHRDGRRQLTPAVRGASIRSQDRPVVRPKPAPDIHGRLVTEHELVRYDTSRPGDPEVRWELATVTRMTRGLQEKNPTYYNVRLNSNNQVSKSVELLPDGTWQVWRGDRWWSPDKERPVPDAQGQPQL